MVKRKIIPFFLSMVMVFTSVIPAIAATHSLFTDLSTQSWCYGYVSSMVSHGYIKGYEDNSFRAGDFITRAETATVLSKLGLPAIFTSKEFVDVPQHAWYHDTIQQAYSSGAMLGVNNDTTSAYFAPNDYLTRADAAVIASRLIGFQDGYSGLSLRRYSDYSQIAFSAEKHFQNVVKAGIMSGYPDGTLRPNQPITRGEFSRIFNFLCYNTTAAMRTSLEQTLRSEGILGRENALASINVKFDVQDSLTYGQASSAKIKLNTTNIPNGGVVNLTISNNGGSITIPQSVAVFNDTASFYLYTTRYTANQTYVLTAEYQGMRFSTNVYLNKSDYQPKDVYIKSIDVERSLRYGRSDSIEVVVKVNDIPDGEYIYGSITGSKLNLDSEKVKVRSGKATFVVNSKSSASIGSYTFEAEYEGHYKSATIKVAETTSSSNAYIISVTTNRNLIYGQNDTVIVTVRTNNLPNGAYISATLSGTQNGNTIYPADAGLSVSDHAVVYGNKAEFTIYSSYYTTEGEYSLVLNYNGTTHRTRFYVGSASNSNQTETGSITSISVDGDLYENEYGQVKVTVKTSGVQNGTYLYPKLLNSDLTTSYRTEVHNNTATFYVYNEYYAVAGSYALEISYNGKTYSTTIRVRTGTNSSSSSDAKIKSINIGGDLYEDEYGRVKVTVKTSGVKNGTYLYPEVDSRDLSVPYSVEVYDNEAVFYITNEYYAYAGTYHLEFYYNGKTYSESFKVRSNTGSSSSSGSGYVRSIDVNGYLYENENGRVKVTVKTNGVKNGTYLYPEINCSDLGIPYKVEVYDNEATFYITNEYYAYAGTYELEIYYNGETHTATVRVR